jgi:hypothetical protein
MYNILILNYTVYIGSPLYPSAVLPSLSPLMYNIILNYTVYIQYLPKKARGQKKQYVTL